MELSVRDWMIIVGLLLIVAVLFDGFRRMRNDRRGKIRMSLNKNFVNSSGELKEGFSTELPGGPRVILRDGHDEVTPGSEDDCRDNDENDDLQLDESVPMLMESITATAMSDHDVLLSGSASGLGSELKVSEEFSSTDESDSGVDPDLDSALAVQPESNPETAVIDNEVDLAVREPEEVIAKEMQPLQHELPVFDTAYDAKPRQGARHVNPSDQEVIVVNVMAKDEPFKGADLLHILLACDCRFGEMSIFHRYEDASGEGSVQFSVVNSVEPGIFNLDDIDNFTTPGVCFFVTVPGPQNPIQAFDYMVETAQCLLKNLNGELRDETHSVMTSQTIEHCRQRIRDIERKQLTHA